ncbi:nucleolar complex protein 3 [Strigomonas culicis]|uniref:Nucleolar complex protein 3 n=1 Tax=Strigomonas culicis TaxID=28005 RepID=S9VLY7_9TRYP|nr:nucleolar complex protein 3 [Strigomonas culicis]|eukprot:EPY24220.1 nucleolar complex protein 3 [Strigomonas culicis]
MQRYLMNTSYLQDRLKALYALHKHQAEDYGQLVTNLNEECDILCDTIPNYRIASTLEKEDGGAEQKKKREVYNVQKLEHEILKQYEHFLQLLRKLSRKPHPEQQALGSRLCAKLIGSSAPEFNHAETLLSLAIDFANSKSVRVAQPCMKALAELLDGQMVSEATEHIVAALLDIVRKRSYAMNPKLLNLLLHVRVAMLDMHRPDIAEEKAKNKRLKKEDKELARQMQKSNARRNKAEVAVKQSRIVHRVFVIYLRVLEASKSCSPTHQSKILAPTLEGLVKFAPLVNVELYHDLMEALKDLLKDEATVIATKLHALVAAATLAQKDATSTRAEWRVDLSYFHEILFECLLEALTIPSAEAGKMTSEDGGAPEESAGDADEVASQGSTASAGSLSSIAFSIADSMAQGAFVQANASKEWTFHVGLVLRAVDLLILSQKHLPVVRVTAILRRIMQFIPYCPPHSAMALLALCHRLALRYPLAGTIIMGGSDNVIAGRGAYHPEAKQTAAANADSSFTWEVSLLTRSYHPTERQVADTFCRHFHKLSKLQHGQPPVVTKQLDALGPYEVMEEYNPATGEITPKPPLPSVLKEQLRSRKRARVADTA